MTKRKGIEEETKEHEECRETRERTESENYRAKNDGTKTGSKKREHGIKGKQRREKEHRE